MKRFKRYMMVVGILASSFAGGAVSHWTLSGTSQAQAAPRTRTKKAEDAARWTFAKPIFTRMLTVGQPTSSGGKIVSGKAAGTIDGTGMKLFDSRGNARIRLESGSGTLAIAGSGGKDRVKVGTVQGGQTGVALHDASGRRRVQIDSGGLKIYNASGREVGNFGFQSDGSMGASVADKTGKLKRIDLAPEPAKKP